MNKSEKFAYFGVLTLLFSFIVDKNVSLVLIFLSWFSIIIYMIMSFMENKLEISKRELEELKLQSKFTTFEIIHGDLQNIQKLLRGKKK